MSTTTASPLHCAYHPDRETSLRCNRCEQPICPKCAILTPTGYRCKSCIQQQQRTFNTARWYDYPLALCVAAVLSFAGSWLASILGWLTIFIAPTAGIITAETVRFLIRKRRSNTLFRLIIVAVALGSLPYIGLALLSRNLWGLLWPLLYTVIVSSTTYYRLTGIQIR